MGASSCAGIALVIFGGVLYATFDPHPMDREARIQDGVVVLILSVVIAGVLGLLAGVASRLPVNGILFLRCCIIVGSVAVVVRLLTMPNFVIKTRSRQNLYSYAETLVAAIVMTLILIWVGDKKQTDTERES